MTAAVDYTKDVYAPQLEAGIEYQDYICMRLHAEGLVLQNIQSKRYQRKRENLLGLEIKFDRRFRDTGRLYIETHEKAHPSRPRYVDSGIYRDDDCWLFGIGDHRDFYVFSRKFLRRLDGHGPAWLVRVQTPTSRGFLLPIDKAVELAERHFIFEGDQD